LNLYGLWFFPLYQRHALRRQLLPIARASAGFLGSFDRVSLANRTVTKVNTHFLSPPFACESFYVGAKFSRILSVF